ncbi:hypothetical protein COMNV_01265 [Commensalibacter sp. Nvir]|uniref:DUF445 domain-containing protein n=1 Tax=Commensalibacter sp. Nvir TaxID=3069817 RepID=UPI002D749512|nr:hypothetical protein COMNV_01265 [Commensalibacter sp. Nvir]
MTEHEHLAWNSYIRYRRFATTLLMFMGILTFFNYYVIHEHLILDTLYTQTLRAGTQAGFIGGLADWFAVTALFKHPMGLPIPHTAILPTQQKKLGQGIGSFIGHYIFTKNEIENAFKNLNCPVLISHYIAKSENTKILSQYILKSLPKVLNHFENGQTNQIFGRVMVRLLDGESLSPLLIRSLRTLTDNEHYQDIVSFLLVGLKNTLKNNETNLRYFIEDRVREHGGQVLGWIIGSSVATKVLNSLSYEIDRIDPQDPYLKEAIIKWINKEISQFETNPILSEKISDSLKYFISQDSVKNWREEIWKRFRNQIELDIENENGWIKKILDDMIVQFANRLSTEQSEKICFNNVLQKIILSSFPLIQKSIIQFTQNVISNWNTHYLLNRLECRIGKDLQYIRINGSIVGFFAGIFLFWSEHFWFGK